MPYADIIILALIAGFILLRLRSVLGQKTGHDNPNFTLKRPAAAEDKREPVVRLGEKPPRPKSQEETDPYLARLQDKPLAEVLAAIKARDALFSATEFLRGARMAFEMVFDAFAKGEKPTLNLLLSEELARQFIAEIDARPKDGPKPETTLVSVTPGEILDAALEKNLARITVKFTSEQVSVERDAEGKIVGGDPSAISHVEDQWVFERDVTSKNPNWKIIET